MRVFEYLRTRVPARLDASDRIRLGLNTFAATALSVGIVHLFVPGEQGLVAVLTHSLMLAVTYTFCVLAVAALFFFPIRRAHVDAVEVWHLWAMSFVAFTVGHSLDVPAAEVHPGTIAGWLHYLRLVPIWMVVTYVFIEGYTRARLRAQLAELESVNAQLTGAAPAPTTERIDIASGKKRVRLDAYRVSHVSVEDHYCYIHYRDGAGWKKTDVALPLREVLEQLPESFLLVHRSHVVNPAHLERIEREGRSYRIILDNDVSLPISRHRLDQVLPEVRKYLGEQRALRSATHPKIADA